MAESIEAFAARIRAGGDSIPIVRGQQQTTFSKLSRADQNAHIDRWFADGIDPLSAHSNGTGVAPPTEAVRRAEVNKYPVQPGEDPELFYGWVQRALIPGPGFEWAMIEVPRHIVEGLAKADRSGRKLRKDTREVMTSEIVAGLADWNLGNRVRGRPLCNHRFFFNPAPITDPKTGKVTQGRSECVQCGTPEAT